jgi:hypothetical protein
MCRRSEIRHAIAHIQDGQKLESGISQSNSFLMFRYDIALALFFFPISRFASVQVTLPVVLETMFFDTRFMGHNIMPGND